MPTDNTLSWSWSRNYAESDLISVCQEFVLNGRKVAYGKQDNTQNIKKKPSMKSVCQCGIDAEYVADYGLFWKRKDDTWSVL